MQAPLNLMLSLDHPTMLLLCCCKDFILLGLSLNWPLLNTCVIGETKKIDNFDSDIFSNRCRLATPRRQLVPDFFVMLSNELCMI